MAGHVVPSNSNVSHALEAARRLFHPGTVARRPECSGVRITACVCICVPKVKWSVNVCSYVSAADRNESAGHLDLAVSVELPGPHEGLTKRRGLQSVSHHCTLPQESLFCSDCTQTLSPVSLGIIPSS